MKFRCGESWLEKETRLRRLKTWHRWFAWYPVTVSRGHCCWLEYVERIYYYQRDDYHSTGYRDAKS